MTTPTALLAEARLQAEAPASTTTGRTIFIARARTLLPQLADAVEAVTTAFLKSCPWCFKNLDDDTPSRQISHLVDCGDRHRDEAQAYPARVRKWAIQPWQRALPAGKWWSCRKCGAGWEGSIERHKSDCFATPLATATVEQGEAT